MHIKGFDKTLRSRIDGDYLYVCQKCKESTTSVHYALYHIEVCREKKEPVKVKKTFAYYIKRIFARK